MLEMQRKFDVRTRLPLLQFKGGELEISTHYKKGDAQTFSNSR